MSTMNMQDINEYRKIVRSNLNQLDPKSNHYSKELEKYKKINKIRNKFIRVGERLKSIESDLNQLKNQ